MMDALPCADMKRTVGERWPVQKFCPIKKSTLRQGMRSARRFVYSCVAARGRQDVIDQPESVG